MLIKIYPKKDKVETTPPKGEMPQRQTKQIMIKLQDKDKIYARLMSDVIETESSKDDVRRQH